MKFLISRLSALGDTVCSLPAAVALKQAFPESHVSWAVDPRFAGIVECCDAVDTVLPLKPSHKKGSIPDFPEPFDAALDLQGLLKSALVVRAAKSSLKLGYHWQREGASLFSTPVLPDPSSIHVVDQYVDVARAAIQKLGGEPPESPGFRLAPREEDLERVRELLAEVGVAGPFVVMNAGAGWATKRWPAPSFAQVIDLLHGRGVQSVLIGGKSKADQDAAGEVLARCQHPAIDLLGKTSVRQLVALLSLANGHLAGDTGSSHIAAAINLPTVGLYSITKPQRSCPYGQIGRTIYDPDSLANIVPDLVFARLWEAIQ
jgi:ADP-heptose:LPS heptosyltransferase